jgi:hypothetical protein
MAERQLQPSWDGSVVLDIGGDVGALVLRVSSELNGVEIDLEPTDASLPHTHSAVRERRLAAGSTYAAVYPSLKAGTYSVEGSGQEVTILGGRVTELAYEPEQREDACQHRHPHVHERDHQHN